VRILFAGTPEIAVPSLVSLAESMHDVVAVLTAPDRPAGRGQDLRASPVKQKALELGIPILQPERLGSQARAEIARYDAELLACAAYGRIFGPKFLSLFARGGINLHPSLLPLYRGPAPIPAAILAGDEQTGVTIQEIALETDSGDILAQTPIDLDGTETAGSLSVIAAQTGASLMREVVDRMERGELAPVAQERERVTLTRMIRKTDGEIDWNEDAVQIDRTVRAYHPWPLAFTSFQDHRLNILGAHVAPVSAARSSQDDQDSAADTGQGAIASPGRVLRVDNGHGILIETGNGLLAVTELQLQARKALSWKDFTNGVAGFVGAVLGG